MIITFNCKDVTKTIPLNDVKRAMNKDNLGLDLDCHGAPNKKDTCGVSFLFGLGDWT